MTHICSSCIGEPILRTLVSSAASKNYTCDYCERGLPAAETWFIAQKCDEVLATFYEDSSQTMAVIHFNRIPAGEDLQNIVKRLVQAPEAALEDILDALRSMWFDADSGEYDYVDGDPWFVLRTRLESRLSADWTAMESSLRGEARYLNPTVVKFMDSIFGRIEEDATADGTSVLRTAGFGSTYDTLYRARVFQTQRGLTEALQHPEKFLGAPAAGIGDGGRMNASGQPAFYGATSVRVALAEVRPPVGSWVAVAKFSVIRPLTLLDLALLGQVHLGENASLFDATTKIAAQRRDFLQMLCEKMIAPVMPESQDHNYLITQVVADYLAMHPSASIDGIIYPSVQCNRENWSDRGENVVLFHKAAGTVNATNATPTAESELWEYEDNGPSQHFRPTIMYRPDEPDLWDRIRPGFQPKPALELVRASIEIHRVRFIDIRTDATPLEVIR